MSDEPLALVTGATGGIGGAIAQRLKAEGFNLLLTDLSDQGAVAGEPIHTADLTDEAAVKDLLTKVPRRLSLLVHCAGQVGAGPLADVELDTWRRLLDVNLTSAYLLARHGFSKLSPGGQLLLFSSSNGINGGSALSGPAYAVAKAGVINLTRYLAKEWAQAGVRVNCIAPGPVDTPMLDRLGTDGKRDLSKGIPLGRLATADDVASTVAFLASDAAGYLTGTVHNISGGLLLD